MVGIEKSLIAEARWHRYMAGHHHQVDRLRWWLLSGQGRHDVDGGRVRPHCSHNATAEADGARRQGVEKADVTGTVGGAVVQLPQMRQVFIDVAQQHPARRQHIEQRKRTRRRCLAKMSVHDVQTYRWDGEAGRDKQTQINQLNTKRW